MKHFKIEKTIVPFPPRFRESIKTLIAGIRNYYATIKQVINFLSRSTPRPVIRNEYSRDDTCRISNQRGRNGISRFSDPYGTKV